MQSPVTTENHLRVIDRKIHIHSIGLRMSAPHAEVCCLPNSDQRNLPGVLVGSTGPTQKTSHIQSECHFSLSCLNFSATCRIVLRLSVKGPSDFVELNKSRSIHEAVIAQ